jgi:large subunit ribosomal protein L24
MNIRAGDRVAVLSGDDRTKRGNVLRCLPKTRQVVVEGVNVIFRHVRRSQKYPKGGRIQKEAPVSISRVALVCPKCHAEIAIPGRG